MLANELEDFATSGEGTARVFEVGEQPDLKAGLGEQDFDSACRAALGRQRGLHLVRRHFSVDDGPKEIGSIRVAEQMRCMIDHILRCRSPARSALYTDRDGAADESSYGVEVTHGGPGVVTNNDDSWLDGAEVRLSAAMVP
jgi:hypothetical protein